MFDHNVDFEPVSELLRQQLSQYTKLLSLAEEMRDCLVAGDVETLEKLTRAQTTQLKQIDLLEKKRLAAAESLFSALEVSGPRNLTELIFYAEGARQAELQGLKSGFTELLQQLATVQAANKALLQTNLDLNDMMLDLMSAPEDPLNNFYGADGSEPEERIVSPSIFDQNI